MGVCQVIDFTLINSYHSIKDQSAIKSFLKGCQDEFKQKFKPN